MPKSVIDWKTLPDSFSKGEIAMMYHSSANLAAVRKNSKFSFGVANLPANIQNGTVLGGGNLYIFKDIPQENKDAAWEFIRFVTQPDYCAQWSMDTGYIATRKSAYETERMNSFIKKYPEAIVARNSMTFAGPILTTHHSQEIHKIISDAVQTALSGNMTPKEALDMAQNKADASLASFN
jgi:sn-glycerol 3-phosphate transport system substrate-binding protein